MKDKEDSKSMGSNARTLTSTIADYVQYDNNKDDIHSNSCVVYKFRSRPPYEGFVLILFIVLITVLFIWWLNNRM